MMAAEEDSNDFGTSCWDALPQHILVSVLIYLTPKERLQAALTCKSWSSCLNHPLLWHRFVCQFLLPAHEKVLGAVELHGHQIRALVILVDQEDQNNRQNACKVLYSFARNKMKRLASLTIRFLGQNPLFYAGQEFIQELHTLFGSYADSKETPGCLTHLDLSGLDIAFSDSLFNTLSKNHPNLEFLNIQNKSLICKVSPECMHLLVTRCKKLRELRVVHLSLTDIVLTKIAEQEVPRLQHLSILYKRESKYAVDLSSEAWSKLVQKIPSLRVTLAFDHTCPLNRIADVMKPEIPVTELRLETFTRIYEEVNHATNCYHKTLEKVVLHTRNSEELGKALIRLAENCQHLHSLMVYCVLNASVINEILDLRPEIRERGSYILKSRMEEGPWVVGAETNKEAEERLASQQ